MRKLMSERKQRKKKERLLNCHFQFHMGHKTWSAVSNSIMSCCVRETKHRNIPKIMYSECSCLFIW